MSRAGREEAELNTPHRQVEAEPLCLGQHRRHDVFVLAGVYLMKRRYFA